MQRFNWSQLDQAGNLLTLTVLLGRNLAPPGAHLRPTVVQPEAEINQVPFNQSITYKLIMLYKSSVE